MYETLDCPFHGLLLEARTLLAQASIAT